MKKQKINAKLFFEKKIIGDLSAIRGGSAPITQPVNTYRCETAGPPCGTDDPLTNPSTCSPSAECGNTTFRDTFSMCGTIPGIQVC